MARPPDLIPGETLIMSARRHWIVLFNRIWKATALFLLVCVGAALVRLGPPLGDLRWFVVLALLLALLVYWDLQYVGWRSEVYTITDKRVIVQRGVLRRYSRDISLARVQDVTLAQGM